MVDPLVNVFWSRQHEWEYDDEGHRDPLRAQVIIDSMSDNLFRSDSNPDLIISSLTDHLMYLVFHGWAESFCKEVAEKAETSAYNRLVWQHAWVNYPVREKKKIVVYGVRLLRKYYQKKIIRPAGWQTWISPLVVLGPRERYRLLWESLPPDQRNTASAKFMSGFQDLYKELCRIVKGNTPGLIINQRIGKLFSLYPNRLGLFKKLAKYFIQQPLPQTGLGLNLQPCRLGDSLRAISSSSNPPNPDTWTYDFMFKHPRPQNSVGIRLYRAALGRALVYAATWSFYEWAFRTIKEDLPGNSTNKLRALEEPFRVLKRVKELTQNRKEDRQAFFSVDNNCRPSGTFLKISHLLENINSKEELTKYSIECARRAGKGYVIGYQNSPKIGDKNLIIGFAGNFAGSLRLPQAWHFGRDLMTAIKS